MLTACVQTVHHTWQAKLHRLCRAHRPGSAEGRSKKRHPEPGSPPLGHCEPTPYGSGQSCGRDAFSPHSESGGSNKEAFARRYELRFRSAFPTISDGRGGQLLPLELVATPLQEEPDAACWLHGGDGGGRLRLRCPLWLCSLLESV